MASWQVNQARNHWSELLNQAESEGPQIITHHGKDRAVVLSMDAYRSLRKNDGTEEEKADLVTFLLSGPKFDLQDADVARDYTAGDPHLDLDDLDFAAETDQELAS